MRGIVQFAITTVCIAMVGAGLYLSMGPAEEGLLLDRPGAAGRLQSVNTSATAFFELDGDALELTMLFTEPDDPNGVFKTRVRLADGQTHSIVVGDNENGALAQRFTFRRVGYTVEMNLAPEKPVKASFNTKG